MPNVVLLNQEGKQIGELELNEAIFGVAEHQQAIFDTIIAERAAMRQGTQKAKTRAEVRGGGRKPWRQKGTGRARHGSIRSPQWRGGGVAFAPSPRSHAIKINKKVVRLAMKSVLSEKVRENAFVVVDKFELYDYKTKSFIQVLNNIKVEGKILVLLSEGNPNVELAGRNLPNVIIEDVKHASVYQVLNADYLVLTQDSITHYEEVLK